MPPGKLYHPETIVFVVDVCEDPGSDASRSAARLELIKRSIGMFAQAKSRVNPAHKFGLAVIRDAVRWEGGAAAGSAEGLMAALRGLQPQPQASNPGVYAPGPGAPLVPAPPPPLDLGAVVGLVGPLAVAEEADGARVRVVLVYCRSCQLPVWRTHRGEGEGLAVDVLYVHDKAAAAVAAGQGALPPTPQDVYTWLEDHVDELSGRCGHHAYILEAGAHLGKKVVGMMISLLAHPRQRPPQRELRAAPLDLAAMPPLPTSSAAPAAAAAAGDSSGRAPAAGSAQGWAPAVTLPLPQQPPYPQHQLHAPSPALQASATQSAPPYGTGGGAAPDLLGFWPEELGPPPPAAPTPGPSSSPPHPRDGTAAASAAAPHPAALSAAAVTGTPVPWPPAPGPARYAPPLAPLAPPAPAMGVAGGQAVAGVPAAWAQAVGGAQAGPPHPAMQPAPRPPPHHVPYGGPGPEWLHAAAGQPRQAAHAAAEAPAQQHQQQVLQHLQHTHQQGQSQQYAWPQ